MPYNSSLNTGTIPSNTVLTIDNSNVVWTDAGSLITTNTGTWYYNGVDGVDPAIEKSELEKLSYEIDFGCVDKDSILKNNIRGIRKNKIIFNCEYDNNNNIVPYEYIMELIEEKKKFSLKFKVSDLLTICYTNFRFTKIENNLNFGENCDFSKLKVKFKYDKILHENHKLSDKQLRTRKLKKILKK